MEPPIEQVQEAQEAVAEATAETKVAEDTLIAALETVERALEETRHSLLHAVHKAKDAETVTKLLRSQLGVMKRKLDALQEAQH